MTFSCRGIGAIISECAQHVFNAGKRLVHGMLTPKLEKVVHTLEWVCIEEFIGSTWWVCGWTENNRGMLANAFVSKAALGLFTTASLIERFEEHLRISDLAENAGRIDLLAGLCRISADLG